MTLPQTVERIADILRRIVSNTTKLNAAAQARTAENCTLLGETAEAHERVAQLVATQSEIGQYFEEATGRVGIVEVESERLRVSIGEMDRHLGALLEDEATLQTALTTVTGHSRAVADIARLARLLAINASVEAARAGDAGRGFAVVAREMQSLSEQSSTRARLIDDLVARLVDQLANMRGRVIGSRGPLEGLNEATGTVIKTLALARRRADETREVVEGTRDRICDETESLQHLLMRLGEVEAQTRFTINRSSENADLAAEAIAHLQSLGAGCDERPLAEA